MSRVETALTCLDGVEFVNPSEPLSVSALKVGRLSKQRADNTAPSTGRSSTQGKDFSVRTRGIATLQIGKRSIGLTDMRSFLVMESQRPSKIKTPTPNALLVVLFWRRFHKSSIQPNPKPHGVSF